MSLSLCLFLSECFALTSYWCEGGCCGVEVGWVCLCRYIDPMPALAEQGWLTQEYIQPRITKKHQCHYHYHSIISLSLSLCHHSYLCHHHYVIIISSKDSHCQRLILGDWVSHIKHCTAPGDRTRDRETSLSLSQSCHCHYHYVIITSLMIMIHRVIRCYWLLLSQSDWLKNTYLIRNNKEPPLSLSLSCQCHYHYVIITEWSSDTGVFARTEECWLHPLLLPHTLYTTLHCTVHLYTTQHNSPGRFTSLAT